LEVAADGRIGVFLNEQARRRVPDEHGAQAGARVGMTDHVPDLLGDFGEARAGGFDHK